MSSGGTAASSEQHLNSLRSTISDMNENVVCIPEGFPGAEEIRANIAAFMTKNTTKVAHLIMIIHDES